MCFIDVAEWHPPMAGMFLWIKLKGIKDTQQLIMERALEKEVGLLLSTNTHSCKTKSLFLQLENIVYSWHLKCVMGLIALSD